MSILSIKDWLGNARISSSIAGQSIIDDRGFAPYGEVYDEFGSTATNETIFTGLTQDVIAGMYDTPNRELQGAQQGRWLSPDPAGAGWNQYAYVQGMPLQFTDPSGTFATTFGTPFPLYHNFFQACDSDLNPTCFNDCTLDGMYSPCSMALGMQQSGAISSATTCDLGGCGQIRQDPDTGAWEQIVGWDFRNVMDDQGNASPQLVPIWDDAPDPTLLAQGPGQAANNCISPGVCKSGIDNLNLMEMGKTNYRDAFPFCSTHVTVDNSTGESGSHVDLFNPAGSVPAGPIPGSVPLLPFHLLFDALPDAIYRVTGQYLLPAGRDLCQ